MASTPGAARVAQAAPLRSEPVEPEERAAPVKTVPAHVARAEPEDAPAEPARNPAPLPFKVEKPATLAERNAEAQRIVATQRAADKAAADKLAAAQKAAEAQKLAEARKAEAAEKVAAAEKAKADAAARKLAKAPAAHADPKVAAAQKAEAAKVAAAAKAAAAQKLAADREAAKAKAEAATSAADAQRTAAAAAKAAKVAAAKPAPAAAAPKAEQVAVADKKVDATPTASLPPAAAPAPAPRLRTAAPVVADAGGPEFRWPARGRIIAGFKGGTGGNDGINIAVPEGTQVKAAEGGVVAYAGSELKGYGNLVLIRHPERLRHRLCQQRRDRREARRNGEARRGHRQIGPERQRVVAPAPLRGPQGFDPGRPDRHARRDLRLPRAAARTTRTSSRGTRIEIRPAPICAGQESRPAARHRWACDRGRRVP